MFWKKKSKLESERNQEAVEKIADKFYNRLIKERTLDDKIEELIKKKVEEKTLEEKAEQVVVNVIAKKIFNKREEELNNREAKILNGETILQEKIKRFEENKKENIMSLDEIIKKQKEYTDEMHKSLRETLQIGDDSFVKANVYKHTLDFILWLIKK